ncbi:MAG: hypothetical protein ABI885_30480, partial [Gammaproteobacteria bacterium]
MNTAPVTTKATAASNKTFFQRGISRSQMRKLRGCELAATAACSSIFGTSTDIASAKLFFLEWL